MPHVKIEVTFWFLVSECGFPKQIIKAVYHYSPTDLCFILNAPGPYDCNHFKLPRRITDFNKFHCTDNFNEWKVDPVICQCGKNRCSFNDSVKELANKFETEEEQ